MFQQGNLQGAMQEFQEATHADPANADGYYNLAATYHRLGQQQNQPADLARADTYYRMCLDRNPNHCDAHRGLTVLLSQQCRDQEALHVLESWVGQQPSLAEPKVELARYYEEKGNRQAAMERLTEAVRVEPSNARAWAALGSLRENLGDPGQALANYQRSLQLNNSQPQIAARVAALQSTAQPAVTVPGSLGPVQAVNASPPGWR